MARLCEVCRHPKVRQIDQLLKGGGSLKQAAKKFGLGSSSLQRHRANHLETQRALPMSAESSSFKLDSPQDVLDAAKTLIGRVERIVDQAEADGDLRNALAGLKLMQDNLVSLFAKYFQLIDSAPKVDASTKVLAVLDGISTEELRAFLRGDVKAINGGRDA